MQIVQDGSSLKATWFPVTIDPNQACGKPDSCLIRDCPGESIPEVCFATMDVIGGTVLETGPLAWRAPVAPGTWDCPAGTYYHEREICPFW
jgi:hypothetical protein